jgi:putative ABC transport system ATP-binding protein
LSRSIALIYLVEHSAALNARSDEQAIRASDHVVSREHRTTLMITHWVVYAASLGEPLILDHQGGVIFDDAYREASGFTAAPAPPSDKH